VLAALLAGGCAAATSDGFSVQAPPGWEDRTDTAELKTGIDYQAVYEGPQDGEVIATLAIDDAEPPGAVTLAAAVAEARRTLADAESDIRLAAPRPAQLDGTPAQAFDAEQDDRRRRMLVAVHGDRVYTISLTAAMDAFDERARALEGVVASWRWDS
jgi:hypothetical protein